MDETIGSLKAALAVEKAALADALAQLAIVRKQADEALALHTEAEAELDAIGKDMEYAAGECVVPMPQPGTDAAKLLSANVLLRAERDRFAQAMNDAEDAADIAQKRIEALEGALRGYLNAHVEQDGCCGPGAAAAFAASEGGAADAIDDYCELRTAARAALASPSESAPQPTPETRVDLEALEKLLAEGTPGPWEAYITPGVVAITKDNHSKAVVAWAGFDSADYGPRAVNAALIVAAVNALPALIAIARRAAPTGQQQEAGASTIIAQRPSECRVCHAQWSTAPSGYRCPYDGGELILGFWRVPAAAPPSAPQEGLFREGLAPRDVAAYLLDRADQYETESPCWIALADVARNIARGAVAEAVAHGEFDAALYARVDSVGGKP